MGTPSRHLIAVSALILTLVSDGPAFAVEFCKWTDESGVVHYSKDCPEDVSSTVVPTQDKRTQGQIQAAEEHSKSLLSQTSTHRQRTRRARDYLSGIMDPAVEASGAPRDLHTAAASDA